MKKLLLIFVGFVLALTIFVVAGVAYAQGLRSGSVQALDPPEIQAPDDPEFPNGRDDWGRGSRGSRMGRGMIAIPGRLMDFGLDDDQTSLMHDYLWPAIVESFGLTNTQIEAFSIVRETIQGIQENLAQEEIRNIMKQAISVAIENAVSDGAISEEQAGVWLERLEQMEIVPFGGSQSRNFRQGFSRGVNFGRQMMVNHKYFDAAIAEMLEVPVEDLQELKIDQGFNLKTYADEQGLNEDEFNELRMEILTVAVNMALEDGAIKQEQANWVLENLENTEGRGGWFDQP